MGGVSICAEERARRLAIVAAVQTLTSLTEEEARWVVGILTRWVAAETAHCDGWWWRSF